MNNPSYLTFFGTNIFLKLTFFRTNAVNFQNSGPSLKKVDTFWVILLTGSILRFGTLFANISIKMNLFACIYCKKLYI